MRQTKNVVWMAGLMLGLMAPQSAHSTPHEVTDTMSGGNPPSHEDSKLLQESAHSSLLPFNPLDGFKPQIEEGFADAEGLRQEVKRFDQLSAQMQKTREQFSLAVNEVLSEVAPIGGRPDHCPVEKVASLYNEAKKLGNAYIVTGHELSLRALVLTEGQSSGEAMALTPELRQQIHQASASFKELSVELAEMRAEFHKVLGREMAYAGCTKAVLAKTTHEIDDDNQSTSLTELTPLEVKPAVNFEPPTIPFHINNAGCGEDVKVVVDGVEQGQAMTGNKATFRTTAGPHALCLLPKNSSSICGERGTLRHVFIHDGWTVTMTCPGL